MNDTIIIGGGIGGLTAAIALRRSGFDVSLFAANGLWGHYYIFCYSDPAFGSGGAPCTGAPSGWSAAGGTSFAAPIVSSIG